MTAPRQTTEKPPRDWYLEATNRVIAALESGLHRPDDFKLPWIGAGAPINALRRSAYRGINILTLSIDAAHKGFDSREWATFKQWKELGADVRKGEHGSLVLFWKTYPCNASGPSEQNEIADDGQDVQDEDTKTRHRLVCRGWTVFNADQVTGYVPPTSPSQPAGAQKIERLEKFVAATGAAIKHGGERAYYSISEDAIHMPPRDSFISTDDAADATERYYGVILHELTHWSGAASRLNRQLANRFGSQAYAMEELCAELGSHFLGTRLGVEARLRPDHVQYLANWIETLRGDKRAIVTAASKASDASEYLLEHGGIKDKAEEPSPSAQLLAA